METLNRNQLRMLAITARDENTTVSNLSDSLRLTETTVVHYWNIICNHYGVSDRWHALAVWKADMDAELLSLRKDKLNRADQINQTVFKLNRQADYLLRNEIKIVCSRGANSGHHRSGDKPADRNGGNRDANEARRNLSSARP